MNHRAMRRLMLQHGLSQTIAGLSQVEAILVDDLDERPTPIARALAERIHSLRIELRDINIVSLDKEYLP